jgi:DNA-binding LytR/AlgR family response regulator
MVKIAICDDNLQELTGIQDMVQGFVKENPETDFTVRCFNSAFELLAAIESGASYHIYLLDIVMPCINGIDVGESIRKKDDFAIIIYLTSSQDYALESFRVFAYQYLLKPIQSKALYTVLKKAFLKVNMEETQMLSVKTKNGVSAVYYREILFVEYKNHSLLFYLADGSTLASVKSREPFERTANELLKDNRFVRPHVSFVVNMNRARAITGKNFLMANGSQIPISQKNYTEIKNKYLDFQLNEGKSRSNP